MTKDEIMTKITIEKSPIEQAINTIGYYASVAGEDGQDTMSKQTQSAIRTALDGPAVEPIGWPAGSAELHASLLQMGKSMAKERSREIGDAWNQLADLLALLAKARRTSPPPPAEVPMLTPGEVALMWVAESFDTMSHESCYARGVKRGEQVVRQKAGLK